MSGLEALPSRHVDDWSSRLLRLLDNSDIVKNRFPLHYHGFFNSHSFDVGNQVRMNRPCTDREKEELVQGIHMHHIW